jgi:hypothetical protein
MDRGRARRPVLKLSIQLTRTDGGNISHLSPEIQSIMQNLDRPNDKTALEEFNRDLMGRLRGYQISLQVADQQAKAAIEARDRAVIEADARVEAMQAVVTAMLRSLRPYGLDRKKFVAAIRTAAESVPAHGPRSVQHTVLHAESMRVLKRDRDG